MIGSMDLVILIGGYKNDYNTATSACYACNVNVTGAPWRWMQDVPVAVGITHRAVAIVGMKLYMCGGYVLSSCFVLLYITLD
jgi:hypothetical protein